jgi:hypothetical protein
MNKYRLLVHGENFLIPDRKRRRNWKSGFYTNVFVEANSEVEAEKLAFEILRNDHTLNECACKAEDMRPTLSVEEMDVLPSFDGCNIPRSGLAFYHEPQATRKSGK